MEATNLFYTYECKENSVEAVLLLLAFPIAGAGVKVWSMAMAG